MEKGHPRDPLEEKFQQGKKAGEYSREHRHSLLQHFFFADPEDKKLFIRLYTADSLLKKMDKKQATKIAFLWKAVKKAARVYSKYDEDTKKKKLEPFKVEFDAALIEAKLLEATYAKRRRSRKSEDKSVDI